MRCGHREKKLRLQPPYYGKIGDVFGYRCLKLLHLFFVVRRLDSFKIEFMRIQTSKSLRVLLHLLVNICKFTTIIQIVFTRMCYNATRTHFKINFKYRNLFMCKHLSYDV